MSASKHCVFKINEFILLADDTCVHEETDEMTCHLFNKYEWTLFSQMRDLHLLIIVAQLFENLSIPCRVEDPFSHCKILDDIETLRYFLLHTSHAAAKHIVRNKKSLIFSVHFLSFFL